MAIYDSKPSVYEANGDGSFTYRWNIREMQTSTGIDDGEQRTQWECNEVVVWATVTREKLMEAVLASLWSSDYEAKLINDYNAAKEGVLDVRYIQRYTDFLTARKDVKLQVEQDYAEFVI
ncbi:MAG: hypothetical protein LBG18_09190 [Mediterranea sp.]|jgi:hypothetical protein|nr:hypothetical protein [Mediterranea sp.]